MPIAVPSNDYIFFTEWQIPAPVDIVYEILKSGRDYPRWWPDVYLEAHAELPEADGRVGDTVMLLTKGRLPYRLRWTARLVRLQKPTEIELTASGDFVGRGLWRLEPHSDGTHVTFDWRIRADKPLLRWFSSVLKPLFRWNHRWAMATGLERLKAEASRRLAATAPRPARAGQ
jgi:uncharacterized protein YndB with AHSA1/START domain